MLARQILEISKYKPKNLSLSSMFSHSCTQSTEVNKVQIIKSPGIVCCLHSKSNSLSKSWSSNENFPKITTLFAKELQEHNL